MQRTVGTTLSLAIVLSAALTACATPADQKADAARPRTCVQSVGSNICRDPDSGTAGSVYTVTGDDARAGVRRPAGTN